MSKENIAMGMWVPLIDVDLACCVQKRRHLLFAQSLSLDSNIISCFYLLVSNSSSSVEYLLTGLCVCILITHHIICHLGLINSLEFEQKSIKGRQL